MKKFFLLITVLFFASNILAEAIYEINSCGSEDEIISLEANTRSNILNVTNTEGPDAEYITLFNPLIIYSNRENSSYSIISAEKTFEDFMKLSGRFGNNALLGSRYIKFRVKIDLKAKTTTISMIADKERLAAKNKNLAAALKALDLPGINSNNNVIGTVLYKCKSINIIRDFDAERRKAEKETEDRNRLREERNRLRIEAEREIARLEAEREIARLAAEKELKEKNTPRLLGSGSGFFINNKGYIATNYHVINGCMYIKNNGLELKTIITDPVSDIAVLQSPKINSRNYLKFANNPAKKGQDIFVIGFPLGKVLSSESKATKGIVSSLQGLSNNYSNFQIDAAIQPGSSGGPIISSEGYLLGMTVSTADYEAIYKIFDTLPQNMNFGIKASVLMNILDSNDIDIAIGKETFFSFFTTKEDSFVNADRSTLYLECWGIESEENKGKVNQLTLLKTKSKQ